jgi:hypothetical protein
MKGPLWMPLLILISAISGCGGKDKSVVAHFPFDGSVSDASGKGHHAGGELKFAEGKEGEALLLKSQTLEVPNSPDLQLRPDLSIDCWTYFEEKPLGTQVIVVKESEYLLRVDDALEGGQFSFFVYLNGWEPRVSTVIPEPGQWYHLVAKWTGKESSLEVNGQKVSAGRSGTPKPTSNSVFIGKATCRIDELKLKNATAN